MAQLAAEAREAILAGDGYTLVADKAEDYSLPNQNPDLPISMGFGMSFLGLLRRNNSASSVAANAATTPARIGRISEA